MKKEPLIESSMAFVSSCSGIVIVDSRTNSGKIILPAASTLAGRSIIFKDGYNSFANNSLTLSTTGIDTFENNTKSLTVNTNNGFVQLISGSNKWYTVGTSVAGSGIQSLDLVSTVSGLGSSGYLSSIGSIKASTIQLTYDQTVTVGYDDSLIRINSLVYANGIWVAAGLASGSDYVLQNSSNGFTWNNEVVGADGYYPVMQTVRYLNSTFFAGAVGDSQTPNNSTILTSVDGSNWIAGTTPSADIYDFGYNNSFYLACGTTFSTFGEGPEGGIYSLFKSYNSSNWLQEPSTNMTVGRGLTYASSIWVMVGSTINNNGIETSIDGCNWSVIENSNIYVPSISNVNNSTFGYVNYIGNKVAYNSSIWVTTGNLVLSNTADVEDVLPYNFPVLVSYDANTWFTPSSLLISENVNNCGTSVLWSGSNWIVGLSNTSNATTLSSIITSSDGLDWTYQTTVETGNTLSMAKSDSLYIAGIKINAFGATLEYSLNGLDWVSHFSTTTTYSTIITTQCNALLINGSVFSYNDNIIDSKLNGLGTLGYVSTSYLTSEFARLGTNYGYLSSPTKLLTENFCVAGANNGCVSLSYDGLIWSSTILINTLTSVNAIEWNGSYWVAVGAGTASTIVVSSDGFDWRHASTNALNVEAKGVAWNGSYWVATGTGSGSVTMAVSVDGFNWLAASNSLFVGGNSDTGLDVAWNGTHWIAVGISTGNSNTIILSSDGYNWSTVFERPAVGFYANSVAWNGSYWLVTTVDDSGTNSMLKSYDSYNWSYLPSNPFGSPSIGYSVAWNGTSWLAGGFYNATTNVVSRSTDGNNWTVSSSPVTANDITWNGSYWIITGVQNVAISRDGSNWQTPLSNTFPGQIGLSLASRRVLPYIGLNITGGGGDGGVTDVQITSTVTGLGTLGYVSSMDATISTINGSKAKYTTENMCVAIDNGNNKIVVSLDGINWTSSLNNPFYGQPWNVAWNGAYWLAVGDWHTALSADGYNWTSSINDPANGGIILGLAWNGSYWAAVGDSPTTNGVIISSNGYNWTSSINNPFSGSFGRDIAWNGSYWVAVGGCNGTNTIAVSSDGYTWNSALNNPFNESSGFGIAWNGSYWVAVGDSPTTKIAVSTDGYNWTSSINNPFDAGWGYDIAWNGLYWVVVGGQSGYNVSAAVSTDGYNWTSSINNPFSGGFGRNITWNGVYWIASGDSGATVLAVSRDGYNWNSLSNTYGGYGNTGYGIASRRVLPYVGFNDTSYASKSYVNTSITGLASTINSKKLVTENMCVAISGNPTVFAVSYDGLNWQSSINNVFTGGEATNIAWNGSYWVATGYGTNSIAVSSDGYNWQSSINNIFTGGTAYSVAWNGSYWVAAGSLRLAVSADGYNWQSSINSPFTENAAVNVAWNGSYWVAVGIGGNKIAVSYDGYNWQNASNDPFGNSGQGKDIAWNGTYWVAVGLSYNNTSIAVSSDGYNWTSSSNNPIETCLGIAWNGSYWVTAGIGGSNIAVSYNGYNWQNASNNILDASVRNITWNGSYWIAVGSGSSGTITIALSSNGYNWTSSSNNPFPDALGLAIASRRVLPYVGTQIIPNALTTLYNPLYPSIWASPQPSTIQSAIDRLAVLLSTFTTSNIP